MIALSSLVVQAVYLNAIRRNQPMLSVLSLTLKTEPQCPNKTCAWVLLLL